jgi:hypothetical protein
MAQTNFTPISLYYSTTATNVPSAANLVAGELAINTQDGKLFYKDAAGVVQTIASKAGNINVSSFSGGTTGLTPNTATTGVVTLAGTLGVANGGTGATTLTLNNVLLGNGTSAPQVVAPGTSGNVLTSNGTTWASTTPSSSGSAKAWVYFGGQVGGTIIGSYNVSSITKTGTGAYTINFTNALANANYAVAGLPQKNSANNGMWMNQPFSSTTQNTTTTTKVQTTNNANSAEDAGFVSVVVFGS